MICQEVANFMRERFGLSYRERADLGCEPDSDPLVGWVVVALTVAVHGYGLHLDSLIHTPAGELEVDRGGDIGGIDVLSDAWRFW